MLGLDGIGFYVVLIHCVKYCNITITSTLCDWEVACLITVDHSIEVGNCHIDIVFLVIRLGFWYWCHGVLFFGDGGLIRVACYLALLDHVAYLYFCFDFYVTAYS